MNWHQVQGSPVYRKVSRPRNGLTSCRLTTGKKDLLRSLVRRAPTSTSPAVRMSKFDFDQSMTSSRVGFVTVIPSSAAQRWVLQPNSALSAGKLNSAS